MKQSQSTRRITPYEEKVKQMRLLAKSGDSEAQSFVEKLNARVRKAKLNISPEKMREYWNRYNRDERADYRKNRELAEAGDAEAKKAVDDYRAEKRKEKEKSRRKKGILPLQTYILYVKAAAQPEHVKAEKANQYAKEWQRARRQRLKAAIATGDTEAKEEYDKLLATNRASHASWREKKRRERQGTPNSFPPAG